VVSISGCDPLDPGSNPGTAITIFCWLEAWVPLSEGSLCVPSSFAWACSVLFSDQRKSEGVTYPPKQRRG
jgi:hypothetical protein